MQFVRIAFAAALFLTAWSSVQGQSSSGDYPYLLRLEHATEVQDTCVLLQRDGHYHFERVLSDKALVYEGSISSDSLREIQTVVNNDELAQLNQAGIPVLLVAPSRDELDLRIARATEWQQLKFSDAESRKPFHQSLNPLLKWFDALPAENRTQLNEDEGKNNCLPPRSENVQLAKRGEAASSVPIKASAPPDDPYILRILVDQLGPGVAKRTCAIVYPNGFYHLEKSRQKYYGEGVYHPDVVNQGVGGKIKADVFEQFLDTAATADLRKLLDNPDLVASRHSSLPTGVHYSDADITSVYIPRESSLQQLTFTNYFGADHPHTVISAGGTGTSHVDSDAALLSPLQKWMKSTLESRKAARLKDAFGDNCTAVPTQALPSQISSELAQIVPAEFDSANAEPSEPTPARVEPVDSPTANVPPIPTKDLNEQTDTGNQPAISLRVTTRMVLLDVVATDKNGKLIADLHPTDVAILEDGRPQSIKLFSLAANDSAGSQKKTPQLPPNVFSNRPEYRQPAGPLVLLLLDGINTATTDQAYARRQMLQYVRTLKSDQRVAIFGLTTDLLLLQDFTSDPQTLRTALEHYSSNDSLLLARGAPATINSQMADVIAATPLLPNLIRFNQENAIAAADDRVRLTLSALQAVARAMIGYPGRKNLIWVSSGLPVSIQLSGSNFDLSQNYTSDLANTAALLSQAEVSVYPVDARGLIGNLQDAPSANEIVSTVQSSGNDGFGAGDITRIAPLVTDSHAAMEQVAHETGGRAFYNVNNLASAVAAGVEDGSSYYTLGYYPENKNWDGKFRKISIKSDRKDIKLRFRPGYYAFESSDATAPLDTHQERSRLVELSRAIKDPLPATGVAFWAHLIPAHNGDSATYVEFLVDANSISFAETRDHHNCNLDFAAFSVASNGSVADTVVKNVETPLPASQYANVRKRGVPFRMRINSLPENGSLRLAVRDNRTGLLGTLTIPVPPKPQQAGANQ